MMNEKTRKVFDLLGVEPNEEFRVAESPRDKYMISECLIIGCRDDYDNSVLWNGSIAVSLRKLLTAELTIIKLPQLTEADKNAVRYLRDGGMKYVARDCTGSLSAYKTKPIKFRKEGEWLEECNEYDFLDVFENLFQFVQWTDEEPFCIEDLEV